MLRDIEELSTDETANALDIRVEEVESGPTRCDRVVAAVMTEIRQQTPATTRIG